MTDLDDVDDGSTAVDFDLHGFVRVRLVDPTGHDVGVITRQLGPLQAPVTGPADITIRFVDVLPGAGGMTFVGWPELGFTEDGVCHLLSGRDGVPARTRIPFEDVGAACEITCERRAGHVPHLLAIVNVTALGKGVLPLHASAFIHRGVGVLAAGWAKGGKTETLLAFAERGAHYVGDEWVYLTPEGRMYGVPEPIRLWHWHVRQLPRLWARLDRGTRARLAALPTVSGWARGVERGLPAGGLPASVLRRAAPVLERQAFVQVPPHELFGQDAVVLEGRLDHFLLLASHDRDRVTVDEADASFLGRRMLASLEEERAPFMKAYRQFRFACPDRVSDAVESVAELERDLIEKILAGRPSHVVRHPYPLTLSTLVRPVESIVGPVSPPPVSPPLLTDWKLR